MKKHFVFEHGVSVGRERPKTTIRSPFLTGEQSGEVGDKDAFGNVSGAMVAGIGFVFLIVVLVGLMGLGVVAMIMHPPGH